jgi:Ca2+-binding EF-hand superfamily protein
MTRRPPAPFPANPEAKETSMKRALFAATAAVMLALAVPGAQAAGTDSTTAPKHSRTGYFDRLDANKDGAVTAEEMVVYRHKRFTEVDANGDGSITKEEFMAYSPKAKKASATSTDAKATDAKATDAKATARKTKYFDRLDANKDGTISGEEWDAVAQKQFAALDADKDGKVTKDEMAAARSHHHHGDSKTPAAPGNTQQN